MAAIPQIMLNNGRTIPQAITSLDRGQRTGPDPDKFGAV